MSSTLLDHGCKKSLRGFEYEVDCIDSNSTVLIHSPGGLQSSQLDDKHSTSMQRRGPHEVTEHVALYTKPDDSREDNVPLNKTIKLMPKTQLQISLNAVVDQQRCRNNQQPISRTTEIKLESEAVRGQRQAISSSVENLEVAVDSQSVNSQAQRQQ